MTDTIELLEAIGSDAVLRHAAAAELAALLRRQQPSDALKQAAACGDASALPRELVRRPMPAPDREDAPTPPPSLLA